MTTADRLAGRLLVIGAVLLAATAGWSLAGYPGAAAGSGVGLAVGVLRWRRRQPWSWLLRWLRRNRPVVLVEPVTVVNASASGGVRCQDGVAAVAVQVLGRAHLPTLFTGSTATATDNTVDIVGLVPLLRQSLGLRVDSLSVVSAGARRRSTGDYAQAYDTLIGTPPYAGRREVWVIARVAALANVEALAGRTSLGTAALAAAQRIGAALRQQGVRARVATATDIVELEHRLGAAALAPANRRWHGVRSQTGWLTSYGYSSAGSGKLSAAVLAQAWSMRVDGVIANVTVFPDGTAAATVTVRTAQPPTAPPSVALRSLPGEQALALAANFCGPLPDLRGVHRGALPDHLVVPVGPSGVLLGKVGAGNRLLLPLDDPGEFSRVHIAASDVLAKRIVVRLAGAGERVTVHTRDPDRWADVQMPDIVVTDAARPTAGTTISVVDGTRIPVPRPNTVISVAEPGGPPPRAVNVMMCQVGPASLRVTAGGWAQTVRVELFRAEHRYAAPAPAPAGEWP